jgi:hypothetical protein
MGGYSQLILIDMQVVLWHYRKHEAVTKRVVEVLLGGKIGGDRCGRESGLCDIPSDGLWRYTGSKVDEAVLWPTQN